MPEGVRRAAYILELRAARKGGFQLAGIGGPIGPDIQIETGEFLLPGHPVEDNHPFGPGRRGGGALKRPSGRRGWLQFESVASRRHQGGGGSSQDKGPQRPVDHACLPNRGKTLGKFLLLAVPQDRAAPQGGP